MPEKILFIDMNGMVHLNCPSCREASAKPADQFFNVPQPLQIACACGNAYEVRIEFRKSFRKKTRLEGFYAKVAPPGNFEKMTVTDVSMGGCCFVPANPHRLRKDDRVKLVFNLDNANCTKITREAQVCSFHERSVRCKFFTTPTGLDPDIGFYLRSP